MMLDINGDKTIREVQQRFNAQYPFLKLEFYKVQDSSPAIAGRKRLDHSARLKAAGLKKAGRFAIKEEMTVGELENAFEQFGLQVQVSRKSGILWLETTMTDRWTLRKQNEHGREISLSSPGLSVTGSDEAGIDRAVQ